MKRALFVLSVCCAVVGCFETLKPLGPADMGCTAMCGPQDEGGTHDDMATGCTTMCPSKGDMEMPDLMPMCTVANVASDCTMAAAPICDSTSQTCRACSSSADNAQCAAHSATTPYCDATGGKCVQCTPGNNAQTVQCASATPICDSSETCRKCKSNSECSSLGTWPEGDAASGICNSDGTCAAASQVAFVDNRGNVTTCPVAHATPAGTVTDPYCDISDGVSSIKAVVLVRGQTPSATSSYSHVAISSSRTVTIVGPGQGVAAPAEIFDASANDFLLLSAGTGVNIVAVVDGLQIGDSTNNTLQNIVNCTTTGSGTAKLTIRRSALQHTAGTNKYGLTATGCDVTIDQSLVENNQAGGILLASTDFTVENTVVAGNGSSGGGGSNFGGISAAGTGTGGRQQLLNLTVVDNNAKSTAGIYSGLDCNTGAAPVTFNAVVANNSGSQINASCTLGYSSFAGGTGTNHDITGCTDAQLFVTSAPNFYAPLATATAPCILVGKGTTSFMSTSAPSYDLLGAARPATPSDGAYE